jgi:hypothetical protein
MSICRQSKNCNWYIYPIMFKSKLHFSIQFKNESPLMVTLDDLRKLVEEVSEDLHRYKGDV